MKQKRSVHNALSILSAVILVTVSTGASSEARADPDPQGRASATRSQDQGSSRSSTSAGSRSSGSQISGRSAKGSSGAAVTRRHRASSPRGRSGHHGHVYFGYGYGGHYYPRHYGYPFWGFYRYPYPVAPVVYSHTPGYRMGALDLNVRPKKTEVFVNGQYIGLVKKFDGFPGYLWLEKGTYEVSFYKLGHETVTRSFTVYPGLVLDVAFELPQGEAVLPEPPRAERPAPAGARGARPPAATPAPRAEAGEPSVAVEARVKLSVEPGDASIYLDGRFVGTGSDLGGKPPLAIDQGYHVLEAVRPGYRTEELQFEVQPGEEIELEVRLQASLPKG